MMLKKKAKYSRVTQFKTKTSISEMVETNLLSLSSLPLTPAPAPSTGPQINQLK